CISVRQKTDSTCGCIGVGSIGLCIFLNLLIYSKILNSNEWITIFEENPTKNYENDIFTFCAIYNAASEELEDYLLKYDWGFNIDSFGKSTFIQYGNEDVEYASGQYRENFEYLIAIRYFDKYPTIYEINPKLVWYGNLCRVGCEYKNPKSDEVEIKTSEHKVEIRASYLKDFLSANKSYLVVVFDHRRYFKKDVVTDKKTDEVYSGKNYYAYWHMNKLDHLSELSKSYDYCSSIIGKVIILPYAKPRHEDYKFFFDDEPFEKFVIATDEDGNEIEFECNPSSLANNFGANPDNPHFLTPTYFDIKILDKYKADPRNYEIRDSEIYYLKDWSIPFCINEEEKVVVWLGDLGRISYKEQRYWRAFNEAPKGKMEQKFFARQILNLWTDASRLESQLIHSLQVANEYTIKKYDTVMFLELSDADTEIYRSFVVPTNLSIPEYQQFLMKLCKLTAESINIKLFKFVMGDKYDGSKGSIAQLDDFLKYIELDSESLMYSSIKKAYDSRNKLAGHRASMKEYNKVWKRNASFEVNTIEDAKELLKGIVLSIHSIFDRKLEEQD
ncbi:MAG: hypothetical protein HFI64_03195, partial [Lachnospiraceae bacterium]|nr:hypothetical protein [Lachnospiraceae bacterium]